MLIVGGGVIALLTAVEAVVAGHRVVVCDQGPIPNPRATSYDRHRVLRALHPGDPAATAAGQRAHHAWAALADRLGTAFYRSVGAVSVLPSADVPQALASLPGTRIELPPGLAAPADTAGVFESDAGVLLADQVLAAAAGFLRAHPHAELRENLRAVAVEPDRATVRFADGDTVRADAVLLALGPWSRALMPDGMGHALVLWRQSMLYCDSPGPDWESMPSVRGLGADGGAWLVPPVAGTPLKLSAASACRAVDTITDQATPPPWRDCLIDTWTRVISGFHEGWVSSTRDCYYLAHAPTGGAAVAYLSTSVLSFAACGGASFKFAPLAARSITAHLSGVEPLDVAAFPHSIMRGTP
jgi:sarcosine oxidase